jgi:hypothetical protein
MRAARLAVWVGWRSGREHAMGARIGEAFIPNTVGTRLEL